MFFEFAINQKIEPTENFVYSANRKFSLGPCVASLNVRMPKDTPSSVVDSDFLKFRVYIFGFFCVLLCGRILILFIKLKLESNM